MKAVIIKRQKSQLLYMDEIQYQHYIIKRTIL